MKNVNDIKKFRTKLVDLMIDAVLTISIGIYETTCYYSDGETIPSDEFNENNDRVKIENAIVLDRNYKKLVLDVREDVIVVYRPNSEKMIYKNVDMFYYEDYKNITSLMMALTKSLIEMTR